MIEILSSREPDGLIDTADGMNNKWIQCCHLITEQKIKVIIVNIESTIRVFILLTNMFNDETY